MSTHRCFQRARSAGRLVSTRETATTTISASRPFLTYKPALVRATPRRPDLRYGDAGRFSCSRARRRSGDLWLVEVFSGLPNERREIECPNIAKLPMPFLRLTSGTVFLFAGIGKSKTRLVNGSFGLFKLS